MTERDSRTGSGGTEDNVRDELDEAAGSSEREREAAEKEGRTGSGGVKDNIKDEWDESQERS